MRIKYIYCPITREQCEKKNCGMFSLCNITTEVKKMEEKPKKTENVKDKEKNLVKIQSETEEQQMKRIKFIFEDDFIVTWKPKVEKKEYINGIELIKKCSMEITDMPLKLIKLAQQVNKQGYVKLKISYKVMTTVDGDGNPVKYRFIISEKTFNSWEILKVDKSEVADDEVE